MLLSQSVLWHHSLLLVHTCTQLRFEFATDEQSCHVQLVMQDLISYDEPEAGQSAAPQQRHMATCEHSCQKRSIISGAYRGWELTTAGLLQHGQWEASRPFELLE